MSVNALSKNLNNHKRILSASWECHQLRGIQNRFQKIKGRYKSQKLIHQDISFQTPLLIQIAVPFWLSGTLDILVIHTAYCKYKSNGRAGLN